MGIIDKIKETADDILEKTDLDDKVKAKAKEVLDKTDIDEKVIGAAKGAKGKVDDALDKTDLDEKIKAKAGELVDEAVSKAKDVKGKIDGADKAEAPEKGAVPPLYTERSIFRY